MNRTATPALGGNLGSGQLNPITLSGEPVSPIRHGLPRTTSSLCPECLRVLPADQFPEDGKVWMRKTCPDHGTFTDIVFSDVELFLRLENWFFGDGEGFSFPTGEPAGNCPERCGICGKHTTHTSLANLEITGRCNLACRVCFADANSLRSELSFEGAAGVLKQLRNQRPAPAFAVQFTGGEPTVHPRFLDLVAEARRLGFSHIQVATNGIRFADPDFAMRARDAGLHHLYLQMDGTTDNVFEVIRGRKLLGTKLAVLESARKAGLRIIFVPTIVRGVNDHQIGSLFRLAFENLDILSGMSIQPVTFTGRYPEADRIRLRFTLADLAREFSAQTGLTDPREDWFPLNAAVPLVRFGGALYGTTPVNHSCHPHCGLMALLFVDRNRNAVPVTQFLDLHGLLREIDDLASRTRKQRVKMFSRVRAMHLLAHHFRASKAPEGLTFTRFLQTLEGFAEKKYTWENRFSGHTYKTFFVAGMHFMDAYNYDLDRLSRCGVHYATADGKAYPFCTFNSGPTYRHVVGKGFVPAT